MAKRNFVVTVKERGPVEPHAYPLSAGWANHLQRCVCLISTRIGMAWGS